MSSNYHQYSNDESNYFSEIPNNNTDFSWGYSRIMLKPASIQMRYPLLIQSDII
jgi:ssDNA-specific exonuclease RecJ